MSKLPRTDDLPRAGEGYDPARVEEAFSAFAERVRELEAVAGELRAELRSLRAERRGAPARLDDERWPVVAGHQPVARLGRCRAAAAPRAASRCRGSRSRARSCSWSRSSPASPTSRPSGSCRDGRRLDARRPLRVGRRRQARTLAPRRDRAAARARRRRHDRPMGHADRPGDGGRVRPRPGVEDDRDEAARRSGRRAGRRRRTCARPPPKRRRGLRRRKQPAEAGAADPWEA